MIIPTKLEDLYTSGTKMSEVDPDAIGLPWRLWQKLDLERQATEYRKTLNPADAPLNKKAIWTPRDSYGIKGV